MNKNLPDIEYIGDSVMDSATSLYTLHLWKPAEYFSSLEARTAFINGVEKLVRAHDRYAKYKKYLQDEVKLDHCAVIRDLTNNDCDIELHHGPIFTLYDICSIVLDWYLLKGWRISTYRIADTVLTEHEQNRVNCVMLATSVHEQVHNRNVFINMKQAWGDINAFIDKYHDAIGPEMRLKYNRYIDRSLMEESDDNGVFDLNEKLIIT